MMIQFKDFLEVNENGDVSLNAKMVKSLYPELWDIVKEAFVEDKGADWDIDKKYYTPTIEEFHPGFEYETLLTRHESIGFKAEDWTPSVWGDLNNPAYSLLAGESINLNQTQLFHLKDLISLNRVRVKVLDDEDIKSLGFESEYKDYYVKGSVGILPYWLYVIIDARYEDVIISGKRGDETGVLFRGSIKNKAELKRILKAVTYEN